MTRPTRPPIACIVCGDEFTPSGKQKTCPKPECKAQRTRDRAEARKRGQFIEGPRKDGAVILRNQRHASGPMPTFVAGAIGDVVTHLNKRPPPTLSLHGLGPLVRNVVAGIRSKDRQLYEDGLKELVVWGLLNLSRVRASAEDRA